MIIIAHLSAFTAIKSSFFYCDGFWGSVKQLLRAPHEIIMGNVPIVEQIRSIKKVII